MASRAAHLSASATTAARQWIERESAQEHLELDLAAAAAAPSTIAAGGVGGLAAVLERPTMPALWLGTAAAAAGLNGSAASADIKKVLDDGALPDGKAIRSPEVKNAAYGIVISMPKTISMLLASDNKSVRDAADKATAGAGAAYVAALERQIRTRVGKAGATSKKAGGLIAAGWLHRTSSAGDPHSHMHLLVASTVPGDDGKWRTIDSKIFYAAKRVAEAAAIAAAKKSLSESLDIKPDGWTERLVGSVRVPEIAALMPGANALSEARSHIEDVLHDAEKALGGTTFLEDRLAWQRHRKEKGALAEKIEHALDHALGEDGDRAAALRKIWVDKSEIGDEIKKINARKIPLKINSRKINSANIFSAVENYNSKTKELKKEINKIGTHFNSIKKMRSEKINEFKNIKKSSVGYFFTKLIQPEKINTLEKIINKLGAELKSDLIKADKLKSDLIKSSAMDKNAGWWKTLENSALEFVESLHSWTHSDLTAFLTADLSDDIEAAKLAARYMDKWSASGLAHTRGPMTALVDAYFAGEDLPTDVVHKRLGLHAACVSGAVMKLENQIEETASLLATQEARRLAIDVTGLSAEQSAMAGLAAKGRKLLAVTGVAGAGKSHTLKPVVDGAHRAGMTVICVARNAKTASETGAGIGADRAMSISALVGQDIQKLGKRKPVMLVVDEAGVVDREHWQQLLAIAEVGDVQIVAVGDRQQAQPIDRAGAWHVVQHGAAKEGMSTHLATSYRCRMWSDEATAIRQGDCKKVLSDAENRIFAVPDNADAIAKMAAEKVMSSPGEAVALVVSNREAAEISAEVQKRLQINATTPCAHDMYCGIGDKVRTRKNDHKIGVLNGMRWTVDSVNNGFVTVKNDTGERIVLTPDYCRRYLELDYAMTIDSAQGITVDKAICILRDGMGRSYLYSAATRGRSGPDYLVVGSKNPQKTLAEIVETDDLALTAREIASQIMLENKANKKVELSFRKNLQPAESMGYNNPLPDSSLEYGIQGM